MLTPRLIFIVAAFVLFMLAAISYPPSSRVNLGWLGLAFLTIALWFAGHP